MLLGPHQAIEALYAAFARPGPQVVTGCPCCITAAELDTLLATPLRDLPADALESYASSVMLTVGEAEDLRYFLPRLVELSFRGDLLTDPEIVFSKPRAAGWRTWPEREQRALEHFAAAVLSDMATTPYESARVDEWITGFSRMLEDITPYLAPLTRTTPAAAANLRGFYHWNARGLARGRLSNAFWRDESEAEARVVAWFRRPEVDAAVARAYTLQDTGSDAPAG